MEVFKLVIVLLGLFFASQCLSWEVNEAEPKLLLELVTRGNKTFFAEFATDVLFYKTLFSVLIIDERVLQFFSSR